MRIRQLRLLRPAPCVLAACLVVVAALSSSWAWDRARGEELPPGLTSASVQAAYPASPLLANRVAQQSARPRIAVFSGPTATIHNSPPLVTSNKAREKYGLPLLTDPYGNRTRFDSLWPQRLAAPVTVYVQQFSAHPLERDAAELYAPPDGYLDAAEVFHRERRGPADVPVYEVVLRPEDGLLSLPYMARQADGRPWEDDCASPFGPAHLCRQPFYPDASRIFEEIDRLGIGDDGHGSLLSSRADFDFYRAAPAGGYKTGLAAAERTDVGAGDIPPETLGEHFFPYRPYHLGRAPTMTTLARLTNMVQRALASGQYAGAIWLEGSPTVEETSYWLNLLVDTTVPITANAAQRTHNQLSNDGDHNILESLEYLLSGIWADEAGRNKVGTVVIQDQVVFNSREVQKGDARPGGYVTAGGHGGIVGSMREPPSPVLTFAPVWQHTYTSAVNMSRLPFSVMGVQRDGGRIVPVAVPIKDASGDLLATAIPKVTIVKDGNYVRDSYAVDPDGEVDILARIEKNLQEAPLAGFVGEGLAPYGTLTDQSRDRLLERALYSGIPVVKVGRGNNYGFTPQRGLFISGNNLTATKARVLLMAALMKLGSLPPAADPANPTPAERAAVRAKMAEYQTLFDTH